MSIGIFSVLKSLYDIQDKYDVIAEASNSVHGWHWQHEGEKVINEGVQSSIAKYLPWHMFYTFELVVNVQLRCHHEKANHVDKGCRGTNCKAIPTFVVVIVQAVDGVGWN